MRVFVLTGGDLDPDLGEVFVCVDLMIEGNNLSSLPPRFEPRHSQTPTASLGVPVGNGSTNNTLSNASEDISVQTDQGPRSYRVLDIKHLLAAKLAAFTARGMGSPGSKDFSDLVWLMTSVYVLKVWEVSGTTPVEQRRAVLDAAGRVRPMLEEGCSIQWVEYVLRLA